MKNRIAAFLILAVFATVIFADDYRITGYGNQPVILKSSSVISQGVPVQVPAFSIATGTNAGAQVVSSSAYEASHVLKASGGTLVALIGYNSGAAQWIQVFNSATVPANGTTVPILTFAVAATSNFSVTIPLTGLPLSSGISWSNSSTGPTKTSGGSDVFATGVFQ